MYCATKSGKTTQTTVHCDLSEQDAAAWNNARDENDKYSQDVLDALVQRYEAPSGTARWDSPLHLVLRDGRLDVDAIYDSLYNKAPPPPNQSTQCQPLSGTNFLYQLDQVTQAIVAAVMEAQKYGGHAGQEAPPSAHLDHLRLHSVSCCP